MADVHFIELVKKGAVAFFLRIGGAGLTFLLSIFLARILGASDYGLFMLSLTVVTILSVGVRLGLDTVLVKQIAAAIEEGNSAVARGYFHSAFRLVFIAGIIVTLLGVLLSNVASQSIFGKPELTQPLNRMMYLLLPLSMAFLIAEALKGLKQVTDSTIAQAVLIPGLSLVVLVVGEQWVAWNLMEVITVYVAMAAGAAFYAWSRWQMKIQHGDAALPGTKEMLRKGFPLLLASSGGLIMSWSDTLVLGVYENASTVGIYSVAAKTALLTSLILVAVNSIAAPKFSALYASNDLRGMEKLAKQSTLVTTGLVVFPTIALLTWPEWILKLFGAEYVLGSTALMILAVGQLVNVACGSVAYLLIMSGHERTVRNIMLSTAILNIFLNVLLVKIYGVEGVAVATSISAVIWNIWMLVVVKKLLGFWTIFNPFSGYSQTSS